MNTKEKLELLWKYLFLVVVAIGIFQFTHRPHPALKHFGHDGNHEMVFFGDDDVFFVGGDHKMDVKIIEGPVGKASTIKMVRSIMVKGLEALTAECALAAVKADVLDEVFNSLSAEHPHFDIIKHSIYNFERSISHGKRRAEELKEVSKMLEDLRLANHMSKATAIWQNKLGSLEKTNSMSEIKENFVSFAKQLSAELRDIKE